MCSFKSLMGFKKEDSEELARIIMWNFPVDFFKCFEESYIFTYLWEGSIQKSYFDIHGINYLVQAAEQAGIISGTSASEIQPLITALGNLGYISNMSADGLNNVADSASNVEMSFSDLAKEDSSNLLQEISSVQEALDSQSIGISVSYDDFSSDALADY